ncbi:MAG: NHL repeat-containing protein [Acidobacteriota bacterium]|nr:NHL repeat-containing protein [Acidobacteriota bacterium]
MKLLRHTLAVLAIAVPTLAFVAGCGSGGSLTGSSTSTGGGGTGSGGGGTTVTLAAFTGKVLAGTQPVVGASVQLYAAGVGTAATALLPAAVTTSSTGAFAVPTGYSCPSSSSQLYIVARGGSVGTGSANAAIALLTVVGACGQLSTSSSFVVDEATTAAAAWALGQFLTPSGGIVASATNNTGLANAVATFNALVNGATGTAPGASLSAIATSPAARIHTLANLLDTCAAASGGAPTCTQLFAGATAAGAAAPADTLAAAVSLVQHPALNVATLFAQAATSTAYAPALTQAPADWTLFVTYTDHVMNYPTSLGIDSTGSVWVASYFNAASKLTPIGSPVFPHGITGYGLSDSYGLAIDPSDNVWITNQPQGSLPGNSVTVLNSAGQNISGSTGFNQGGLNYPVGIAIDSNATAWVVDYGNAHVTLFSGTGAPLSGSAGYTAPTLAFPVVVALDGNHNGWIGDQNDSYITRISADGKANLPVACCQGPNGIAVDQRGNVWVANYFGDSLSLVAGDGTIRAAGTINAGGTIRHPQGLAIDGNGNVWVGNFRAGYLTELAGSGTTNPGQAISPAAGWAPDSNLFGAFALAIDASGNLWVSNAYGNSVTEFIGLAAPVKTPLLGLPQAP